MIWNYCCETSEKWDESRTRVFIVGQIVLDWPIKPDNTPHFKYCPFCKEEIEWIEEEQCVHPEEHHCSPHEIGDACYDDCCHIFPSKSFYTETPN